MIFENPKSLIYPRYHADSGTDSTIQRSWCMRAPVIRKWYGEDVEVGGKGRRFKKVHRFDLQRFKTEGTWLNAQPFS